VTSQGGPAPQAAGTPGRYAREIVRYDQARWALAARCLSKDPRLAWEALGYRLPPGADAGEGGCIRNLANTDPPGHTRLRRLLGEALTPARMKSMAPRIAAAASVLAERMQRAGSVDLVASFLVPLQVMVTCELLGIPPSHRRHFGSSATGMLTPADGVGLPRPCHEAYGRMGILIGEVLAAKRARMPPAASSDRQQDLLSALIAVHAGSDSLTVQETQSMAMLLISAGQEPTIDLIANGILALLRHPDQLALFRRYPELRPRAVEELLRHEAPVRCAVRIAAEDVEIEGTVAARGAVIAVMLDRAHRDPSRFAGPDSLDITREHNPHLTFGHGIHYCIGAPLARLQARVALAELVCRFPRLALDDRPERLRWRAIRDRRSLVDLPVTLDPSEGRVAAKVTSQPKGCWCGEV
jgi:cytochrome P450